MLISGITTPIVLDQRFHPNGRQANHQVIVYKRAFHRFCISMARSNMGSAKAVYIIVVAKATVPPLLRLGET